jgi:hypothetical protein
MTWDVEPPPMPAMDEPFLDLLVGLMIVVAIGVCLASC